MRAFVGERGRAHWHSCPAKNTGEQRCTRTESRALAPPPKHSALFSMVYDKGQQDLRISLVAGAVGGLISDACVHPVDTVKTRLWCSSAAPSATSQVAFRYLSFSHALTSIVKAEGARSLYKGFSSVALFTTVGHALYFGAYELGKTVAGSCRRLCVRDHLCLCKSLMLTRQQVNTAAWQRI